MLPGKPRGRSFFIENLGCSKNQVDAEVMISSLLKKGWNLAGSAEEADYVIVNTCGFIEPAKKESIETVISFRRLYPDKKIVMAGCFAQRYGEDVFEDLSEVDGIFGNRNPGRIGDVLEDLSSGSRTILIPNEGAVYPERENLLSFPGSAFVKIAEGCSHGCSYCAIPLIRGRLRSRPSEDVVSEIKSLAGRGVFEINLIAQDLAAYGTDRGKKEFAGLLKRISDLEGDFWIRLLYVYPDHFPLEILEVIKNDERILPYFDIPFQHADGDVLKKMGRTGSSGMYLDLIGEIRNKLPDAVIRSTFMIGFPGEGRRERERLLSFLSEASLDWAGFFVYSREENTRAYRMRGSLAHGIAVKRAERFLPSLENLQQSISTERMSRFAGKDFDILIEEPVPGEPFAFGRGYMQAPEVDGSTVVLSEDVRPGEVVRCRIVRSNGIDLEAKPLNEL